MIKAIWFALKIGAVIAMAVWIADQPGEVNVAWMGYDIRVQMGFFLLLILSTLLLTLFLYQTIKTFVDFPKSLVRYNEVKAREKGYVSLTKGLTAVAAGDRKAAAMHAKKARKFLPDDTGLPVLLEAQSARLDGREDDAAAHFVTLLEDKDASFLGVRGLLQSALDNGEEEGALALAEKALALHPKQGWILNIAFDLQTKLSRWDAAEKTLSRAERAKAMDAERIKSDRVALLLARAQDNLDQDYTSDAALLIKRALKLSPGFVPAAIMAADMHLKAGQRRKAKAEITKAWKVEPHGALAAYWMGLIDEDSDKLDHVRWIEKLLKSNSESAIGQRLAGIAASEAKLWGEARAYFERAEELEPRAGVYQGWAAMEEAAGADESRVRELLVKAAESPGDKAWVCQETGAIFERWQPMVQGARFNSIQWARPNEMNGRGRIGIDRSDMQEALIEAPRDSQSDAA